MEVGPSCNFCCCFCGDYWRGSVGCCNVYCCCGVPVTEEELQRREEEKKKREKNNQAYWASKWNSARLACFNFMKDCFGDGRPVKSYDVEKIYWDADGNLRQGGSDRDRNNEVLLLLEADEFDTSDPQKIWVAIPSRWIREWLLFAQMNITTHQPGPIHIDTIITQDMTADSGWRPLKTLKPPEKKVKKDSNDYAKVEYETTPGHYRLISLEAWRRLVKMYGIAEPGVVVAVKGNTEQSSFHDLSRWRVFPHAMTQIDPAALPDPIVVTAEEKTREKTKKEKRFLSLGLT